MSSNRLQPFFASMPGDEARKIGDIVRYLSLWMVFKDPPEHTRLRRLTSRVLHVKSMQGMRPQVRGDRRVAAGRAARQGPVRLHRRVRRAAALPGDHGHARRAARAAGHNEAVVGRHGAVHRLVARLAGEVRHRAGRDARAMAAYFRALIAQRRADAARRPAQRAGAPARRRRSAERGRAGGHLHLAAVRRARDHHQPHCQRLAVADAAFPARCSKLRADPSLTACRGRGAAAPRRPVGRAGAHRAGGAPASRQDTEGGRPRCS